MIIGQTMNYLINNKVISTLHVDIIVTVELLGTKERLKISIIADNNNLFLIKAITAKATIK